MKCGSRFKICGAVILFVTAVILLLVLEDKCETYDPLAYIRASISWLQRAENSYPDIYSTSKVDKIIIIPALETEDVSWVAESLPDWQRAIYIVNPSGKAARPKGSFTTPFNKGHEAMAYLTYIIENYNAYIPSVLVFAHAHQNGFFKAWHVDTPFHDNVASIRTLNLDFVQQSGYVNLRCNWNPGCKKVDRANAFINGEVWQQVFGGTSTPFFNRGSSGPGALANTSTPDDYEKHFPSRMMISAPCCAQFAISRDQLYARPLNDYVYFREWLIETELSDAESGRVMEFLWHIIFGKEAVHCRDQDTCYCQVYGRC